MTNSQTKPYPHEEKWPSAEVRAGNQLCAAGQDCCTGRQSGKGALQSIIGRLRRKADNLQTVVNMLPEQPTPEQDQHLWELAQDLGG